MPETFHDHSIQGPQARRTETKSNPQLPERRIEPGKTESALQQNPHHHSRHSDHDLDPHEQKEKENIREEIQTALKELHATLKIHERLSRTQIIAAINQSPLERLTPPFKRQLASVIELRHSESQEVFVQRGLDALDFWIHLQALKRGTDCELENLRNKIKTM
jgi:hypothetical protein